MLRPILTCVFGLIVGLFIATDAFNFAPEFADVFHVPPAEGNDSYFGYTVGLQRRSNAGGDWLIAGAPRANSSHPSHSEVVEPGVVYECKLDSPNTCTPLLLDATGNAAFTYRDGVQYHQLMDNAWIGGSLDVEQKYDGVIAVGGLHWKNEYLDPVSNEVTNWHLNGICYLKDTRLNDTTTPADRFLPLIDLDKQDTFRESNGTKKYMFNFRYGQAGMAVHLVKNSTEVIIGAPGVLRWRGSAIRYQNKMSAPEIPTSYRIDYEYFGYAVTSGKFTNSTEILYYVSSAPRASHLHGSVNVFSYPEPPVASVTVHVRLNGTQLGEYFGASVCAVDLNGDGLDDLVVGAPLHTTGVDIFARTLTKDDTGDEGRAYVYINTNDGNIFNTYFDSVLTGSRTNGARFGTAIASIGDINADGYNDVAIGAPYEDDGRGSIYIYHGRMSGIKSAYSQKIRAEDVGLSPSGISGFGISISNGLDSNGNGVNDIAVGAYSSGHAVFIKAYPTIVFQPRISTNFDRLDIGATNFTASMCLSFTGKTIPRNIYATVTLKADSSYRRAHIVQENNTYNVTLHASQEFCGDVVIAISVSEAKLFTKPIELYMGYELNTIKYNNTAKFCKYCPVVDPNSRKFIRKDVYYAIGCDGTICRPDLRVNVELNATLPVLLVFNKATLSMRIMVSNLGDTAYLMRLAVTIPRSTPLVRLPPQCQETDPADLKKESPDIQLVCAFDEYFMKGYVTPSFLLEVNLSPVPPGTASLVFRFEATSDGEEQTPSDNVVILRVPLETIADAEILGTKNQEREQVNLNIKQTYSHTYEIRNYGPSPLHMISADFHIPMALKTSNGTLDFVVTQLTAHLDSKPIACTRSDQYLEPPAEETEEDNEESAESTQTRKKRVDEHFEGTVSTTSAFASKQFLTDRTLFLNCSNINTTCMSVRCTAGPFTSAYNRAIISFRFTADLKKLEQKLDEIDLIVVSSSGRVTVSTNTSSHNNTRPDVAVVSTIFYGELPKASVDTWIFAVSIALGILILIIIVAIFVKVGFFKRQKKEDLRKLMGNMEVEEAEKLLTK